MDEINRIVGWMWVLVLSFPVLGWLTVVAYSRRFHLQWLLVLMVLYGVVFAVMR